MSIQDFPKGTTKKFNVLIASYYGAIPDITNDTVMFYMKDDKGDTNYVLTSSADVSSSGSSGVAKFNLTPTETDLDPKIYQWELIWTPSGSGEVYLLDSDSVRIIERL